MLDLEGLTMPTTLPGTVTVELIGAYGTEIEFTSTYVTVAIDEAEDLNVFSVEFTFNQEEYKNATDKEAYLAEKQDNPFTYADGYYVLVKDIDASSVPVAHNAIVQVDPTTYTQVGFTADEITNSLTPNNTLAQDYDGNGTVDEVEVKYFIPRTGYPIAKLNGPTTYFKKVGLLGTFDGQGHIISNIYSTTGGNFVYNGTEEVTLTGSYGTGLFGILSAGSVIKNVAVINFNGGTAAFGLATLSPVKVSADANSTHINSADVASNCNAKRDIWTSVPARVTFKNIYFEDNKRKAFGNFYRYTYGNRGEIYNNIFMNLPNNDNGASGAYGHLECGYFGGSTQAFNQTNNSLNVRVTDVYLVVKFKRATTGLPISNSSKNDITYADTVEGLYAATTNHLGTAKTMAEAFADAEYFTIDGNKVYWHSLAPEAE